MIETENVRLKRNQFYEGFDCENHLQVQLCPCKHFFGQTLHKNSFFELL